MIKNPKVSIIVLNWNRWKETIECLKSLKKLVYPNYEVIVVDNGSTKRNLYCLRSHLAKLKTTSKNFDLKLIENKENLGFAEGNNVAIRKILKKGKSDFILLLNNDTVVEKNFLTRLVKVGQTEEKVGIIGPKIYDFPKWGAKNSLQSAGAFVNLYWGKFPQVDSKEVTKVDFVSGACFLIKTKVIRKIGLLDKRYFAIFEDMDWCLRAKRAGFSVLYVPDAIIWHKKGRSFQKPTQVYFYTRNLFWFEFKNAHLFQLLCFLPYYFIFVFPKYFFGFLLIKRDYSLWRSYVRGLIEGVLKR